MRSTLNKAFVLAVALSSVVALSACTNASENAAGPKGDNAGGGVPTEQIAAAPVDPAAAALLPADVKANGVLKVATEVRRRDVGILDHPGAPAKRGLRRLPGER